MTWFPLWARGRFRVSVRLALVVLLVLGSALDAPAADAEPKLRAYLGFQGRWRVGFWTPLRVELTAGSKPLAGYVFAEVSDPDHTLGRVVAPERIELAPGQRTTVRLLVRPGRVVPVVRVGLVARPEDARPIWVQNVPSDVPLEQARQGLGVARALPTHHVLVVAVGSVELESLVRLLPKDAPTRIVVAALDDPKRLPAQWLGYEGVDHLLLALGDKQLVARFPARQAQAIDRWLHRQGRVTVVLAPGAEAAYEAGHPLRPLVLGTWNHWGGLRRSNALEEFADTSVPVALGPVFGPRRVHVALLDPGSAQVVLRQDTLPLLLRESRGFGILSCLTVDMQAEPLLKWRGRGKFWLRLLELHPLLGSESGGVSRPARFSHVGVTDLAGQLRGALEQFEEAPAVSFMVVSLLILGYLVLAGPVPYLFFRRWPQYSPWSWVVLALLLLAAAGLAHLLAAQWKAQRLLANQVDLVDVDQETATARATSYAVLYTPEMLSGQVQWRARLEPLRPSSPCRGYLSWLGHPGTALGGMASGAPATSRNDVYLFDPQQMRMRQLPLWQWSTRSFVARGFAPLEQPPLEIQMAVYRDEFPRGYLVNRSPWRWQDAWLAYQRWVIRLGEVKPGQRIDLQMDLPRRELQNELMGREMYYDTKSRKMRSRLRPYDPQSFDVPSIVRQMFFHRATGGREYAQLWHRYQGFVDWSEHLELKQGVLVARVAPRLSRLEVNGQPLDASAVRHWSWLRIKFPLRTGSPPTTAQVP